MIIGGSKKEVIKNIKKNIKNNELNKKVEVNDPNLSEEEITTYLNNFYKNKKKITYVIKNKIANLIVKHISKKIYSDITICNEDIIPEDVESAIITSNHFNPLDSLSIKRLCEEKNKKLYIVIQDTNLAMNGFLGFLFNNLDVIPISTSPNYIIKKFIPELKKVLDDGAYVLIYPEEQMWFNYRKPRTLKRGAYQFAHTLNIPIISCFTGQFDTNEVDNEEFNKTKWTLYINKVIYPNAKTSPKTDALAMANTDYNLKKASYESAYNKKLDYKFSLDDIAGFKKK